MVEEQINEDEKSEEATKDKKGSSVLTRKIIKFMTVVAYMSGVSGAGVLLSLYYIFFWDPKITGVRPPGYLKSGEKIGLPQTEARIAPLPEAYSGRHPIPHPQKMMSEEFMKTNLSNNRTRDAADRVLGMLEGDPTPKVLPVAGDDSPATSTQTPPGFALHQPSHPQTASSSSLLSSSPQRHHGAAAALQHRQERHLQRPRHGQGDPLTPAA